MSTRDETSAHNDPAAHDFAPGVFIQRAFTAIDGVFKAIGDQPHRNKPDPIDGHAKEIVKGLIILAVELNVNLNRIAVAQEQTLALANVDIDATIKNGIAAGIEDAVNRKEQENTQRSYIGKKST